MNYLLIINTLIASIKAVEQLMPDSKGKEKFDAVIVMIESVVGSVSPLLPALEMIATTLVHGFRASGLFTKKPTP